MKKLRSSLFLGMLAVGLYLPARSHAQDREDAAQPAVFVMTNDVDRNEVLSYQRVPNGQLLEGRRFATGGRGSGGGVSPAAPYSSFALTPNGPYVFARQAG